MGERCIDVTGSTSEEEEEREGSINPSSLVFLLKSVSISSSGSQSLLVSLSNIQLFPGSVAPPMIVD